MFLFLLLYFNVILNSATSPLMDMMPTDNCPALQYLDDVDKGGVADLAGLKKGDFLLTVCGLMIGYFY